MYLFLKRIKQKIVKKKKINYHKSYSQCGEDLIVKYIFDVIGISNPSYLDIGAHHPFSLSNTALFYKMGSRGVNVEPDPVLFLEIAHNRKRDINLNIGVAEKEGILDFYIIDNPVLNTFSKKEADEYCQKGEYKILKTLKVKVISPQQLIADYCNNEFPQFLSIDAEGIDELILKSIDFRNNFPIVICIETISFSSSGNGIKNKRIIEYLESNGYMLYADTYINSIFLKKEYWQKGK